MNDEKPETLDTLFENLAEISEKQRGSELTRVPSVLKSRLFSALVRQQEQAAPLMPLDECRQHGADLCVFEQIVAISPVGENLKSKNPCEICHARLLGENVENAPIYWPGCPYVKFQNR
ncbi:MAG: hypothetical protein SGI92_21060 [Bryobacteraceae bacterium]|nr:hypothetical protein [Bryobacteraceae bacterium]